jgi:hypothetical protein
MEISGSMPPQASTVRLKNAESASYFRPIGFFRTSPSKKTFVSPFCSATASRYWHLTNL